MSSPYAELQRDELIRRLLRKDEEVDRLLTEVVRLRARDKATVVAAAMSGQYPEPHPPTERMEKMRRTRERKKQGLD